MFLVLTQSYLSFCFFLYSHPSLIVENQLTFFEGHANQSHVKHNQMSIRNDGTPDQLIHRWNSALLFLYLLWLGYPAPIHQEDRGRKICKIRCLQNLKSKLLQLRRIN